METTKQFENEIAPFYWVEGDTGASVCLSEVGGYLQGIFDTRADEGFIGNGYDRGSLAQMFLDEKCPELQEKINKEIVESGKRRKDYPFTIAKGIREQVA